MKRIALLLLLCLPTLAAAAGPPSYNKGQAQGVVTGLYVSLPFAAVEIKMPDGKTIRLECNQEAARLGCDDLAYGDTVFVYYSQRGFPACSWDGVANLTDLVLLYRWIGYWQLLTS
jgi:hypothetical protein